MRNLFEHGQHLLRAAGLLVGGILFFVVVRGLLVPEGFGEYGHYRAGALEDNRKRDLRFAGRQACVECHADIVEARSGSRHERVGCESCHGALAAHATDQGSMTPERPDPKTVCLVCHEHKVSMPVTFPQIDPTEHGGGAACTECHVPTIRKSNRRGAMPMDRREFLEKTGLYLVLSGPAAAAFDFLLAGRLEAAPDYNITEHYWAMIIDIEKSIDHVGALSPLLVAFQNVWYSFSLRDARSLRWQLIVWPRREGKGLWPTSSSAMQEKIDRE